MITRLSHATIYVRDQNKAYDVYVNKLGFKVRTDQQILGGMRWLTVIPPAQSDLEIVLAEPAEPMFSREAIPHLRALLDADALGGGNWFSLTSHPKE